MIKGEAGRQRAGCAHEISPAKERVKANVDLRPGEGLVKNYAAFVTICFDINQMYVKLLIDLNGLGAGR
jgi:hypothetical protein